MVSIGLKEGYKVFAVVELAATLVVGFLSVLPARSQETQTSIPIKSNTYVSTQSISPPFPAKSRTMIFCDESWQTEKFFVLGALYFIVKAEVDHKAQVAQIEAQLRELKERYGLFGRAKWEKVPPARQENKLEGYKRLI